MDSKIPAPDEVTVLSIDNLGEPKFDTNLKIGPEHCVADGEGVMIYSSVDKIKYYMDKNTMPPAFETAGPRAKMFFDPSKINAGIVTCGGLCPGLNDVIRTVTLSLLWQYKIKQVWGFRYGYEGVSSNRRMEPIDLTPKVVENIQNEGGTILGSSRGPQDPGDIVDTLLKFNISILFTVGGDGTFKGAHDIAEEIERRGLPISIIGIPKTIDNDIYFSEKTFGFETAVEEARKAIYIAHEEAKAGWNGIGLVKLMGRHSGFIAVNATLANSDVNFCLIPEAEFKLEGEGGLFERLYKRIERRQHAVIVVAEGAGQDLIKHSGAVKKDASGNVKLQDVGIFLNEGISEYFKSKKFPVSIKYIDPSYTIRSGPSNASDSVFCIMLGRNAVHAGMAGKTNMFVGYWNHHFTNVPMALVVGKRRRIDVNGDRWQTVCEITE